MMRERCQLLAVLGIIVGTVIGIAAGANESAVPPAINISLSEFSGIEKNGQAFSDQTALRPNSTMLIEIINIPPVVSFVILQVHTQEKEITIGYSTAFDNKTSVTGSNVGLQLNAKVRQVFVLNKYNESLPALVAAVAYTSSAPVPGGCNMEFNIEVSPFQKISYTDAMLEVDSQPASAPATNGKKLMCEKNSVTYEAYRLYITEGDYTDGTYFGTMAKMLTVDDIRENGEKVPRALTISQMRRVYASYPGTGSVYAMIATYQNYSSAYVSAFSYACSPLSDPESCYLLSTTMSKLVCAFIFFLGIFLTFIGHGWFCAEMFSLGLIAGGLIGHVCLLAIGFDDVSTQLGLATLIGSVTGIVAIALWCIFGMPWIAILQASLLLGTLVASTTYYGIPDGVSFLESNANFWMVYASIIIMIPLVLCLFPLSANILCCAFVGAYATILSVDYWQGSSLKFIMINTIRRLVVDDFNVATIHPPIQGKDIWLMVAWILLALFGINRQRKSLDGKPPFPSRGNYTTIRSSSRTPVLSAARNGRRVLVLGEHDDVYHNSSWCCL